MNGHHCAIMVGLAVLSTPLAAHGAGVPVAAASAAPALVQEVDAAWNASDAARSGARVKLRTTEELVVGAIQKTAMLVPPMAYQSYPIPVRGEGGLRVIFLYCVARPVYGEGLAMLAPSHRAVLNASDGKLLEVKAISPRDVGVNDPPQKIFGFSKMPPNLTTEQFAARQKLLFALYDKLLPLFAEIRDPTAKDAESFDALFRQVSEAPLAPYYKTIGAEFFAWLATAQQPPGQATITPQPMSESSLLRVIELFYQQSFSFEQAYRVTGPAREKQSDHVICQPAVGTNLSRAELQTFQEEGAHEPFVTGMALTLAQPAAVDFGRLARQFGPAHELPIPPDSGGPTPYRFLVEDRYELDGFFLVHVHGRASEGENAMVRVTLARFTAKATQAGREVRRVMKQLSKKRGESKG